jgi:DNA polymerase-3 subunit delta'
VSDVFASVPGQPAAVAQLRAAAGAPVHAYLFVGPRGTGKRAAARAFAALLLCRRGGCGECDDCSRALRSVHPDLVVRERTGASITVEDAREVVRLASLSPVEGARKVLVLGDFHLVEEAAPALLKAIEEPPPSTVFVVLAEHVPPDLVTIASRCVRVEFGPVPVPVIEEALRAEGVDAADAAHAAAASGGRLDRAFLLASDPGFSDRERAWSSILERLDGTGATIAVLVDGLLAATDGVIEPLQRRQEAEVEELGERARLTGRRDARAEKELETRHRREQRRTRTDELRFGLSVLAAACRDRLARAAAEGSGRAGPAARAWAGAAQAVQDAVEALERNPGETLLLQALLVRLSAAEVAGATAGAAAGG